MKPIKVLVDKYPKLGPISWLLTIQYLIISLIVARSWGSYSFLHNSISDLGNTFCGTYSNNIVSRIYVCSPRHTLMNLSFIATGLLMIFGAALIYPLFKVSRVSIIGFSCIAVGGIGGVLVGCFPENTISALHVFGATLDFLVGNLGIVFLGFSLHIPKWLKVYTLITGFITLVCLVLYFSKIYIGIGIGGMERLTSYPQTIWLFVFGISYLVLKKTNS